MSSIKLNKDNIQFDTYNDLIHNRLKEKGLSQKWLLKKIIEENQNKGSLQSQLSRWFSKNKETRDNNSVSEDYQEKINNSLNINVKQKPNGKWVISRTERQGPQINGDESKQALDQLFEELKSRHNVFDIPDTPRGHALQGIVNDIVSLFLKIDHLIQEEKNRSED